MNFSEFIGFAGLVITIITGIFFPFIQRPIISYEVSDPTKIKNPQDVERSIIKIRNNGMGQATHVLVSLSGKNVEFLNFTSEPFLSKHFMVDAVNKTDNALFEIDVLPPQYEVITSVLYDITIVNSSNPIAINVSSDQSIGYGRWQMNIIIVSYVAFAIIASLIFLIIYRRYNSFALKPSKKPQQYEDMKRSNYLLFEDGSEEARIDYPPNWGIKSKTDGLDLCRHGESLTSPNGDELGICRQSIWETKNRNDVLIDIQENETESYRQVYNFDLRAKESRQTRCGGSKANRVIFEIIETEHGFQRLRGEMMKIFVAVGEKRYIISYIGDFNSRQVKTIINSFNAVDYLTYNNPKAGLISIRYPSDWELEEKYFSAENNRFSEVVRFSHHDSGSKKSKSTIGHLSIRARNSGGDPFDKYLNKYLGELRRKHFLSTFYIANESETTPYSDPLLGWVDNSIQKDISYKIESLGREQILISERIILVDSKAYHIEYSLSEQRLLPVIYNMINSIFFNL